MSHSEAQSRLTVGGRRSDMFRWALRKGIDKFADGDLGTGNGSEGGS
jgi:hypothetical protein